MKKFSALALALVLVVSMAACGRKGLDADRLAGEWKIGLVDGRDYGEFCEENELDSEGSQVYFRFSGETVDFTTGGGLELQYGVETADGGVSFMLGERAVMSAAYDEEKDTLTWQGSDGMGGSVEYTSVRAG